MNTIPACSRGEQACATMHFQRANHDRGGVGSEVGAAFASSWIQNPPASGRQLSTLGSTVPVALVDTLPSAAAKLTPHCTER